MNNILEIKYQYYNGAEDPQVCSFNTQAELYQIPFVKAYCKMSYVGYLNLTFTGFAISPVDANKLMVFYNGGTMHFDVGYIDGPLLAHIPVWGSGKFDLPTEW